MKRVAIITSSDTGYRGEREDLSGPAIREIVEKNGYEVVSEDVLPDDRKMLSERMAEIADSGTAELILTTGGTGFSPRDITPEATEDIIDRRVPGIPEAMRAYSMTITKRAMLSRSTAGIRKKTLIINHPGSPISFKISQIPVTLAPRLSFNCFIQLGQPAIIIGSPSFASSCFSCSFTFSVIS